MFRRISTTAARRLIQERQPIILDARDTHSFNKGHIAGAVHLTEQSFKAVLRQARPDLPLLIYCYHGNTSQDYARLLVSYGFMDVYSLDGGFAAWLWETAPGESVQRNAPEPDSLSAWLCGEGFAGDDINAPGEHGATPLIRACQLGLAERAEALLAAGADPAACDVYGNDALWAACYSGSLETIAVLLDAGIDIDRQNPSGATALIYAASAAKLEVVAFLLEAGADAGKRTQDDFTALDLAADAAVLRLLRGAWWPRPTFSPHAQEVHP